MGQLRGVVASRRGDVDNEMTITLITSPLPALPRSFSHYFPDGR